MIIDQTHNNLFEFNMNIGICKYEIVFILDKYENQLLKTTDRFTVTCILPLHLLFVLSRIQDFYHETKEQVLLREFTKRKNIYSQLLSSCGSDSCFSLTHSHSIFLCTHI